MFSLKEGRTYLVSAHRVRGLPMTWSVIDFPQHSLFAAKLSRNSKRSNSGSQGGKDSAESSFLERCKNVVYVGDIGTLRMESCSLFFSFSALTYWNGIGVGIYRHGRSPVSLIILNDVNFHVEKVGSVNRPNRPEGRMINRLNRW